MTFRDEEQAWKLGDDARESGQEAIRDYLETKAVWMDYARPHIRVAPA